MEPARYLRDGHKHTKRGEEAKQFGVAALWEEEVGRFLCPGVSCTALHDLCLACMAFVT